MRNKAEGLTMKLQSLCALGHHSCDHPAAAGYLVGPRFRRQEVFPDHISGGRSVSDAT